MANAVTVTAKNVDGTLASAYGTIAFSGTYATGGEAVTAGALGLTSVLDIEVDITSATTAVITGFYTASTGKITLVVPAGTQVANGASLTGITAKFKAVGA